MGDWVPTLSVTRLALPAFLGLHHQRAGGARAGVKAVKSPPSHGPQLHGSYKSDARQPGAGHVHVGRMVDIDCERAA